MKREDKVFRTTMIRKRIQNDEVIINSDKHHVIFALSGSDLISGVKSSLPVKMGEAIEITNKECVLISKEELEYVEVISK